MYNPCHDHGNAIFELVSLKSVVWLVTVDCFGSISLLTLCAGRMLLCVCVCVCVLCVCLSVCLSVFICDNGCNIEQDDGCNDDGGNDDDMDDGNEAEQDDGRLSAGAIVGITIGLAATVAIVVVVILATVIVLRKMHRKSEPCLVKFR